MLGLQIFIRQRLISSHLVAAFKGLPVANISDCMSRMSGAGPRLRPMHKQGYLAGPALTVRTRPGDNLMIHKALAMAVEGDVIVVDACGDLTNALFGEIMMATAVKRGVAGVVLNGAVRDSEEISESEFPIYAAGVTHRGPYKDGPGEINVPIALDGMIVHPGDLILGDADGLLCVPIDHAQALLEATHAKMVAEKRTMEHIAAGTLDTEWIDETLKRIGCNPNPQ